MESGYLISGAKPGQLPPSGLPEVCFVGRSNSGKSSLLNALTGHKGLARTSSTPGRTQMVNLFYLKKGLNQILLADLPGYGFSASGGLARKHWQDLISDYLTRSQIRTRFFLCDIRRNLDSIDLGLIGELYFASQSVIQSTKPAKESLFQEPPVMVILTKSDKLNQKDTAHAIKAVKTQIKASLGPSGENIPVIAISTLKKQGIRPLQEYLRSFID